MTGQGKLQDEALTQKIIGAYYNVYNILGHGFLESVYVNALYLVLTGMGLHVDRERPITVYFQGKVVGEFRADLVVEGRVIVEVKAVRVLDPAHEAQLLNYLRATEVELGLLMNFGERPEFERLVFSNTRKRSACRAAEAPHS